MKYEYRAWHIEVPHRGKRDMLLRKLYIDYSDIDYTDMSVEGPMISFIAKSEDETVMHSLAKLPSDSFTAKTIESMHHEFVCIIEERNNAPPSQAD